MSPGKVWRDRRYDHGARLSDGSSEVLSGVRKAEQAGVRHNSVRMGSLDVDYSSNRKWNTSRYSIQVSIGPRRNASNGHRNLEDQSRWLIS